MSVEQDIFKRGSTTYYWSSKFFPAAVREDVFKLYSFVRVVDNFVDEQPQDISALKSIEKAWAGGSEIDAKTVSGRVLANMREVAAKYDMPREWVDVFLQSMRWDADGHSYPTIDESLAYVYGSAEVIGLMMSRILGLPEESYVGARMQGRAMQWINFCRDVAEDLTLKRSYFPANELREYKLHDLQESTARKNPEAFTAFMRFQLNRYEEWQAQADAAYTYIPRRLRVPIQTASNMYIWTAEQIAADPFVVYQRKVKPKKQRILSEVLRSAVRA